MKIYINNCNECSMDVSAKNGLRLYNAFTVRHPDAFYLKMRVPNWDGKVHFITKGAKFRIGLLPSVIRKAKEFKIPVKILDYRKSIYSPKTIVSKIGDYKLRPEQISAVKSIVNNKLEGISYNIGVIDYTVNAGKSLIMAALYLTYKKKLKTLLITQDSDWLNQAKSEFKNYLPGENITFVQGSKVNNWSNFSIGMIQSLSRNLNKYQSELSTIDMVLVDEADLAGSKTYQKVLTHLYNTRVRIGLSGTIYMSKLKRDLLKNMNLRAFFGDKLAEFKLSESIKKGYSTKTIIKIVDSKKVFGNWESKKPTYQEMYKDTITENIKAWRIVLYRLKFNIKYGRLPALIVCKYVEHCENLYKFLKKKLDSKYNIQMVHVNTPKKLRAKIINDFRLGKIDILVSTTIIARGKNFPLLRYMINTADINSQEKNIQFLGRLVRTNKGKNIAYLDDIHFNGRYFTRHGNHRRLYYQKQNLKVINLIKLEEHHRIRWLDHK